MATVVLLGTLDTKGSEYEFLRARLAEAGMETILVDCGGAEERALAQLPDFAEVPAGSVPAYVRSDG